MQNYASAYCNHVSTLTVQPCLSTVQACIDVARKRWRLSTVLLLSGLTSLLAGKCKHMHGSECKAGMPFLGCYETAEQPIVFYWKKCAKGYSYLVFCCTAYNTRRVINLKKNSRNKSIFCFNCSSSRHFTWFMRKLFSLC